MKRVSLLVLLALLTVPVQAQFARARLQATGLTCALCSNAIHKALLRLPFVASVEAELKTSGFEIRFRSGAAVLPDEIRRAVEDAGFFVGGLKLFTTVQSLPVGPDAFTRIGTLPVYFIGVSSRVLNGEVGLQLVDRHFLPAKEFRRYQANTKMACLDTGRGGACCRADGIAAGERVYHVTL